MLHTHRRLRRAGTSLVLAFLTIVAALALLTGVAAATTGEVRVAAEITLTEAWEGGEYATLVWDSVGAEACDLDLPAGYDPPVGIDLETSGAMQIGPITEDAAPAVVCDGIRVETPVDVVPLRSERRDGTFDQGCVYSHTANDDPIVRPGEPGASESHDFYGNRKTDAFSTFDTLLRAVIDDPFATSCSEFRRDQSRPARNASAYWTMTIYRNGEPFLPSGMHLYYLDNNTDGKLARSFPPGFAMITDPSLERFKYWCRAPGKFAKDSLPDACFPSGDPRCEDATPKQKREWNCGPQSGFRLEIRFPNCWNGVLNPPDHKSHMTYPSDDEGCPFSHPHRLPRLLMEITYSTNGGRNGGGFLKRSDVWTTDLGGLDHAHADYLFAWDVFRLDPLVHLCSNSEARCKGFPPPGADGPIHQVKA